MDQRLASLKDRGARNAAALVVDHSSNEIIAWVVAGANSAEKHQQVAGYQIDAVTRPRQPGSALKPFLYSLALSRGWTAATEMDDSPYSAAIGSGVHRFKNYSNSYYGKISLREALGNSLNIPALQAIRYVGSENYLRVLHQLGFSSLTRSHDFYDEGLALGNGEVSLFELVQGYCTLANRGVFRPLIFLSNDSHKAISQQVFSAEVSSLIGNILSDPWARHLEFGNNSILNLPVQTAVKTGTSSDYHDAWAAGYNYRFSVGVWMGNLDRRPMDGVTGSLGPALALRSVFAELNNYKITQPLYLSPKLIRRDICRVEDSPNCRMRSEYFIGEPTQTPSASKPLPPGFMIPTPGLKVAYDPRIPAELQKLEFKISHIEVGDEITWILNNQKLAITSSDHLLWPLLRGNYQLRAEIYQARSGKNIYLPVVGFLVR